MPIRLYKNVSELWLNRKKNKLTASITVVISLPLIYLLVYLTGGITYVYSHTMYIPILISGIFLGPKIGLLTGVVAGILMGPIMPLEVSEGTQQVFFNWFYRLLIFSLLGFISGYASNILRSNVDKIDELSSRDSETGIPNTNYLRHLSRHITSRNLSVFSVIISNNTNIADVLGIDVYHQLMKDIYFDLTHQSRDIFVIQPDKSLLRAVMERTTIEKDVTYIENILDKARSINHIPLYVDYALGASQYTGDVDAADVSLFTESDIAARHAEVNNLSSFIYQNEKIRKRQDFELVAGFKKAIEEKEIYLAYQPKIHLETNKVHSLEALIRWNHPEKGNIPPDRFIPLIEETKLIHLLTDWVLDTALSMLDKLSTLNFDIGVSINVSSKNLLDPQFFERSMETIERHKADITRLEFEITETQIMKNPEESRRILSMIAKKGIKISLDDFGSGYSSLAYLTQFPIDIIKMDRIFMKNLMFKPQIQQIVSSTINLSKELGYLVVAEGIEELDTADYLRSIHCDYAQGYYFARPMKEEDLLTYLSTQNN
ncbi:EAL domain-containing protein (putative c-di-GMP-specific phosphodiesterase class I) [Acholeplasma morum]|uniref:EAL domain-containing protein n=1 Tax=Paracholeplasma morum TaxID=264637 RepID=UPI00195E1D6F|nr:EAL domain-containing protein [Paracholeplasma morum]MBM7453635.1 EAL domain-containing protein (putative c-di-GMP-specific phosphodiesterase class I) [Paracholeplasma morum]